MKNRLAFLRHFFRRSDKTLLGRVFTSQMEELESRIVPATVSLPFAEGFENGPGLIWTLQTTSNGNASIDNSAGPRNGANSLYLRASADPTGTTAVTQSATFTANLANISQPDAINLSFWVKRIETNLSTSGSNEFSVALSTNGTSWSNVPNLSLPSNVVGVYVNVSLDLDQLLSSMGITPDEDIFIRFQRTGKSPFSAVGISIDDLRLDVGAGEDLYVVNTLPAVTGPDSLTSFGVTFSRPIELSSLPGSMTLRTNTLTTIPISQPVVAPNGTTVTWTTLSPLATAATYAFTIAPTVTDLLGNKLNTDRDINFGTSDDPFEGIFRVGPFAAAAVPLTHAFESPNLANDLLSWSFENQSNSRVGVVTNGPPRSGTRSLELYVDSTPTKSFTKRASAALKLDLTGQSYSNLLLDYWASFANSSLRVEVSGDGSQWTEIENYPVPSRFQLPDQYIWRSSPLGERLSQAGIALDSDVYVRWVVLTPGTSFEGVNIDDVRVSNTNIFGPYVTSVTPQIVGGVVQSVIVTFGTPIDPSTFSTADISIVSPSGSSAALLEPIDTGDQRTFVVSFSQPILLKGSFSVSIGPQVTDQAGLPMNQNRDGDNGGPNDSYQASFDNPLTNSFAPNMLVDFESGEAGFTSWSINRADGTVEITNADNPIGTKHLRMSPGFSFAPQSISTRIDLAGFASATDLYLSFDAQMIGDISDGLAIQVSDDGVTWKTIHTIKCSTSIQLGIYQNYVLDLDSALRAQSITFDSDVHIRFSASTGRFNSKFSIDNIAINSGPVNLSVLTPASGFISQNGTEDTQVIVQRSSIFSAFNGQNTSFSVDVLGAVACTLLVDGVPVPASGTRLTSTSSIRWNPPPNVTTGIVGFYVVANNAAGSTLPIPFQFILSGVNDAPVVNQSLIPTPRPVIVNSSGGTLLSTTQWFASDFTAAITDVDSVSSNRGIAVVSTGGSGIWSYNRGGSNYISLPAVSEANAFLLPQGTALRYTISPGQTTAATVGFYAWDQTSGTAYTSVNISNAASRGGTTAYSIAQGIYTQQINLLSAGGPYVIDEGSPIMLAGSLPNASPGYVYEWLITGPGGSTTITGAGLSTIVPWSRLSSLMLDGPGSATVAVRALGLEQGGTVTSSSASLTINSVPPTTSIVAQDSFFRGFEGSFIFTATDPSPFDQAREFLYEIDWDGNGSFDQSISGPSSISVSRSFPAAGTYTVFARSQDANGDIGLASSLTFNVAPYRWANGTLTWFGTAGDDEVRFEQPTETNLRIVETKLNGLSVDNVYELTGYISPVVGVEGVGLQGNDLIDARGVAYSKVRLYGSDGNDRLYGGSFDSGSPIDDTLYGDQGLDTIWGGFGNDEIYGGDDADLIYGDYPSSEGRTLSKTLLGSDRIEGGAGNDLIYGDGDGGEGVADTIGGDAGDDTIYGDGGDGAIRVAGDSIQGGTGNDTIYSDGAEGSNDIVDAGDGDDYVDTRGGNDTAFGGNGDDILLGGDVTNGADDRLIGGAGRDILVGDVGTPGLNVLVGGADIVDGGSDENLIITGIVNVFSNPNFSWLAVRQDWIQPTSTSTRRANLLGTTTGLNGSSLLVPGTTIFDDVPSSSSTSVIDHVFTNGDGWLMTNIQNDLYPGDYPGLTDDLSPFRPS